MNYFRCIGGNGGGGAPLEFTKTSVVDKTQFPNIAFNSDYTNYDLILFVYNDTQDNRQVEFLATPEMLDEVFNIYGTNFALFLAREKTESITYANHYARLSKTSNSILQEYDHNYLEIVDVYSINCNKTISKTDIYKKGDRTRLLTPISYNDLFDFDMIFVLTSDNGFGAVSNQYANLMGGIKSLNSEISFSVAGYQVAPSQIDISNNSMSDYYYFMVQGIKFT